MRKSEIGIKRNGEKNWMTKNLKIYSDWKDRLKSEEKLYNNVPVSEIMYRARTNNLQLQDKERHSGKSTKWIMCGEKLKDLNHFMLWRPAYNEERAKDEHFQRPYVKNEGIVLGELLFTEGMKNETKEKIWKFSRREKEKRELNLIKLQDWRLCCFVWF